MRCVVPKAPGPRPWRLASATRGRVPRGKASKPRGTAGGYAGAWRARLPWSGTSTTSSPSPERALAAGTHPAHRRALGERGNRLAVLLRRASGDPVADPIDEIGVVERFPDELVRAC